MQLLNKILKNSYHVLKRKRILHDNFLVVVIELLAAQKKKSNMKNPLINLKISLLTKSKNRRTRTNNFSVRF